MGMFYRPKNAQGTQVVLLLFNCGLLDTTWTKMSPNVHAIMACYFPAQATGDTLYNTLLATTTDAVPVFFQRVPEMTDYTMVGPT